MTQRLTTAAGEELWARNRAWRISPSDRTADDDLLALLVLVDLVIFCVAHQAFDVVFFANHIRRAPEPLRRFGSYTDA